MDPCVHSVKSIVEKSNPLISRLPILEQESASALCMPEEW
jgi:hypothetical protein